MAQRFLEKKGWRVSVVNNGQEVLDVFGEQKIRSYFNGCPLTVIVGLEATAGFVRWYIAREALPLSH
jgi:hypothetical protein